MRISNRISIIISIIYYLGTIVWLSILSYKVSILSKPPNIDWEIKLNDSDFMKDWEPSVNTFLSACEYYDIKYPRIVTAQAILESGNFKSKVFMKYNNPLGLYNSKEKTYFKFNHWTDAIVAYKNMVEYRYKEGDYYEFLEYIGYAEDKHYIKKIQLVEKTIPP